MRKILFGLVVVLFFCPYIFSETIDISMVEEQTIKNNPRLKVAQQDLNNAKQEYYSTFSSFLPKVVASGRVSDTKNELQSLNIIRDYSLAIEGSLSLFEGFSSYNELREKSAKLKVAQADYNRVVSDIRYEVHCCYINLMWAYETVSLLEKIKERRKENRDLIQLKYNSGNVDIGSLKRCDADVALAEYNLEKAKRNIQTASAALLNAIGRSDDIIIEKSIYHLWHKDKILQKPDYSVLIKTIPEFLNAQYSFEMYKSINHKTKSQWLPSVNLFGSVGKNDYKWIPEAQNSTARLTISYPLFTGSKRYRDVKIASNQMKIASYKFASTINFLKSKAIENYNNLLDACEVIATRAFYVESSKLQSEISTKKYINGLCNYYDWYSIQNDYISAQQNLLDAKKDASIMEAKWLNFIGKGFDSDKEEHK
ncbi:MAG: TolC family protein [Endomicrobium sp.]|jgi:outer membrane protein TolC|uniref:TolC family protein n=1 Tax=Candidatus Endomicrobiellum cubanum TaxID=3242325 RepID=UPI00282BA041|nr:TolC family protein [Endomicrobium sp.]MDR2395083.1 TolC family protein [Endomicrobium sp.]